MTESILQDSEQYLPFAEHSPAAATSALQLCSSQPTALLHPGLLHLHQASSAELCPHTEHSSPSCPASPEGSGCVTLPHKALAVSHCPRPEQVSHPSQSWCMAIEHCIYPAGYNITQASPSSAGTQVPVQPWEVLQRQMQPKHNINTLPLSVITQYLGKPTGSLLPLENNCPPPLWAFQRLQQKAASDREKDYGRLRIWKGSTRPCSGDRSLLQPMDLSVKFKT